MREDVLFGKGKILDEFYESLLAFIAGCYEKEYVIWINF